MSRMPSPSPSVDIDLVVNDSFSSKASITVAAAVVVPACVFAQLQVVVGSSVQVELFDHAVSSESENTPTKLVFATIWACSHPGKTDHQLIPHSSGYILERLPFIGVHQVPEAPLQVRRARIRVVDRISKARQVEFIVPATVAVSVKSLRVLFAYQGVAVASGANLSLTLPEHPQSPLLCSVGECIPEQGPLIISSATVIRLKVSDDDRDKNDTAGVSEVDLKLLQHPDQDLLQKAMGPCFPRLLNLLRASGHWRTRGILLHGPPGVGKTMLLQLSARRSGLVVVSVSGGSIASSRQPEKALRDAFARAAATPNSILVIEAIELVAAKRSRGSLSSARLLAQLLTLMDGASGACPFTVVGITQSPSSLDPALRRPGRLDHEIDVSAPNVSQREFILRLFGAGDSAADLAGRCVGFTGADIADLFRKASMAALSSGCPKVSDRIILETIPSVVPTSRRDAVLRLRPASWDDIGGLFELKQKLRRVVEWPRRYSSLCSRFGVVAPRGFLLYGPPGCAKTTLARALAAAAGSTWSLFRLDPAMVYSAYVGEAERTVRRLFAKARSNAPAMLLLDEIDAMVGCRGLGSSGGDDRVQERVLTTLLNEMDGVQAASQLMIVAATNRPDMLDEALLRPGRLDHIFYVPPPDYEGRVAILQVHTRKMPLANDVDIFSLAKDLDMFTGAEIENVCREAAITALRRSLHIDSVCMQDFVEALQSVRPSVTNEMLQQYAEFEQTMSKR